MKNYKNMKEIIEQLNNLQITQNSIDFEEDLSDEIYNKYFNNKIANLLDVDKHRWYETSISVFKIDEGLFGARIVTDIFGEETSIEDISWEIKFWEMEEIPSVTYKIKK